MAGVLVRTIGRVGRVARAPTRASKAEEEGGKALHGGTPPARHGAAPLGANESKQHRGKERTRARQVTVLPEVGACRSGAPQHERGQR